MTEIEPVPERWRAIPGWEGLYEVSDLGRVRSLDHQGRRQFHRGRILKELVVTRTGYRGVGLHRDGSVEQAYVHELVLRAFVGPRPEGFQTRHLNGQNTDNRLANLKYGTPVENAADKVLHGTARTRLTVATHCKRGHPFDEENTIYPRGGGRNCRECRRANDRVYQRLRRRRLKEAKQAGA